MLLVSNMKTLTDTLHSYIYIYIFSIFRCKNSSLTILYLYSYYSVTFQPRVPSRCKLYSKKGDWIYWIHRQIVLSGNFLLGVCHSLSQEISLRKERKKIEDKSLVTKSKRKSTVFEEKSNCQQDYEYLDHPKLEEDATRLIILIPSHKSRPWCTSLWFKSSFFFAQYNKKNRPALYTVYTVLVNFFPRLRPVFICMRKHGQGFWQTFSTSKSIHSMTRASLIYLLDIYIFKEAELELGMV